MATEIEIGGQWYSIGRLNAKQQFHVSRRVAPVIPKLIPLYVDIVGGKSLLDNLVKTATLIQPFALGIAEIPDADLDYVIDACMGVVQRKQTNGWARVWSGGDGHPMFDDIDMGVMLSLTVRVIIDNLRPFIAGLLTAPESGPKNLTKSDS